MIAKQQFSSWGVYILVDAIYNLKENLLCMQQNCGYNFWILQISWFHFFSFWNQCTNSQSLLSQGEKKSGSILYCPIQHDSWTVGCQPSSKFLNICSYSSCSQKLTIFLKSLDKFSVFSKGLTGKHADGSNYRAFLTF